MQTAQTQHQAILHKTANQPSVKRFFGKSTEKLAANRVFAKLPLVLAGLVVGLLMAETALRLVGYSYPEFYTVDQTRGYALRPGAEGWYRLEGQTYVRINSEGLRDREHARRKPDNTLRIAILGDSYAEALQVSLEQTFWAVMERRLQTCGAQANKKIEVINFGVSGYGTGQELITLREHVWDYSPDIVMLAITTNNDITDNSRILKKTDRVPYFIYRDGNLTLDDSFRNTRTFRLEQSIVAAAYGWIRDHSRVVQAGIQAHRAARILLTSWRSRTKTATDPAEPGTNERSKIISQSEELGTDNVVYLETGDPVWNDAWAVTERLIALMQDEVRSRGAKFIVLTLSNGPQVLPDTNLREEYKRRLRISDLFYPDRRIMSFCDHNGIASFMLAPDLQSYAVQNRVFLHGFGKDLGNGHWNTLGHQVAGELIAQKLCAEGMIK